MKDYQINQGDFLTVLVDEKLEPGYKVAQSVHAVANFAIEHTENLRAWHYNSNYICCLETSLARLEYIISLLDILKIKYVKFLEPDIGNVLTAVAIQALPAKEHKKLFKNLKLTLS